jgi:hypothetical protein
MGVTTVTQSQTGGPAESLSNTFRAEAETERRNQAPISPAVSFPHLALVIVNLLHPQAQAQWAFAPIAAAVWRNL